jgi:hypothetical protein
MTALFTMEMLIKVIVSGFVFNGQNSYMRLGWNVLDFFIVLISLFSLMFRGSSLSKLKALRTVRVLRPLRLIGRNANMKVVINSIIRSVPTIGNVMLISLFFFLLFGIIGVNYFKGTFFYCDFEEFGGALASYSIETIQD